MQTRPVRVYGTLLAILVGVLVAVTAVVLLWSSDTEQPTVNSDNQLAPAAAQITPPDPGLVLPIVNLDGAWTFKTDKGGVFETTVADKTIKIVMKAPTGTSMVYWYGTFESHGSRGAEITSNVIEADKAVLSSAKTKRFVIGDDKLTFSYTAMGVTKPVVLHRG
jgi:hypothetical protein